MPEHISGLYPEVEFMLDRGFESIFILIYVKETLVDRLQHGYVAKHAKLKYK